jgi:hypothetical protein
MSKRGILHARARAAATTYTAKAVRFDGATWLINPSLVSRDTSALSFSVWYLAAPGLPSGSYATVFSVDPAGTNTSLAGGPLNNSVGGAPDIGYQPFLELYSSDNSAYLYGDNEQFTQYPGQWHHILCSADAATGVTQQYLDGVQQVPTNSCPPGTANYTGGPFTLVQNGLPFWIGWDNYPGDEYIGDYADLWISTESLISGGNSISPATIAKFYNAGKPVNLGADGSLPTGTAPAVFLRCAPSAAASTFANNLGTGGAFTITGALTDATTSPSD